MALSPPDGEACIRSWTTWCRGLGTIGPSGGPGGLSLARFAASKALGARRGRAWRWPLTLVGTDAAALLLGRSAAVPGGRSRRAAPRGSGAWCRWLHWRWARGPGADRWCGGVIGLRVWREHLVLLPGRLGRAVCPRRGLTSVATHERALATAGVVGYLGRPLCGAGFRTTCVGARCGRACLIHLVRARLV